MKITEVRIFPVESRDGKLKAFATMTFDDWFVVRNVKVIQGNNGLFVAMPSRKAMDPCPKCKFKNARGSRFCNQCGSEIGQQAGSADERQIAEHMDIAHPIKQDCRVYIQDQVLDAYKKETDRQKKEGTSYKPKSDVGFEAATDLGSGRTSGTAQAAGQAGTSGEEEPQDIEL
jgi:stage V sporulation protein G